MATTERIGVCGEMLIDGNGVGYVQSSGEDIFKNI
jgi:hypothetical protein